MYLPKPLKFMLTLGLSAALLLTAGCASQEKPDPFESYNRKVFKFNIGVDHFIYRPIAVAYDTVTPKVAQHGVSNFFSNLALVPGIANDLLQLNVPWAFADTGRLIVNSTLGLGGLLDPASKFGMKKRPQDFGLTLAKYGVKESPYFILPFLPPATLRDYVGQGLDITYLSVWAYIRPLWISYAAFGLDFTNRRAALLGSDKLIREAFDPYLFVRDAYLQKRRQEVSQIRNPGQSSKDVESSENLKDEDELDVDTVDNDHSPANETNATTETKDTGHSQTAAAAAK